jgi:hypothetical protein
MTELKLHGMDIYEIDKNPLVEGRIWESIISLRSFSSLGERAFGILV